MIETPVKGAAKAAGAVKQATARLTRSSGVLNTLAKEHAEVAALVRLIATARKSGRHLRDSKVMSRVRLLDELVYELLSHATAEEEHVYAALERVPEAQAQVADSRGEHREMERLLHELLSIPFSSDAWLATFERLDHLISHHVEEEEDTLFHLARKHFSREELRHMDRRFKDEKRRQLEILRGKAFALPRGG